MPFEAFLLGQSEPAALANVIFPLQGNFFMGNSYVGLIGGLLALFSIYELKKQPIIPLLIVTGLWGLLASTGSHLGIAQINYELPLLDKIREPGRYLFLFVFCASILAAIGFQYLIQTAKKGMPALLRRKIILTGSLYLVVTAVLYFVCDVQQRLLMSQTIPVFGLIVFSGLFFLIPWVKGWKVRAVLIAMIAIAITVNMKQYPWDAPRLEDGDYFTSENLLSQKVLNEVSKIEGINNYRIIFEGDLNKQQWAMNASYYGLRTFNAYFNPMPHQQFVEMYYHGNPPNNYFQLLGGKYILCKSTDSVIFNVYKFQRSIDGISLYASDQARPRYYLSNPAGGVSVFPSVLREEKQSTNKLTVSLNCSQNAVFVLNEYYSKNWKASINGVSAPTFKINQNQIGVHLSANANLVEFSYEPILFIGLLWLQRITLLLLSTYVFMVYIGIPLFRRYKTFMRLAQTAR